VISALLESFSGRFHGLFVGTRWSEQAGGLGSRDFWAVLVVSQKAPESCVAEPRLFLCGTVGTVAPGFVLVVGVALWRQGGLRAQFVLVFFCGGGLRDGFAHSVWEGSSVFWSGPRFRLRVCWVVLSRCTTG